MRTFPTGTVTFLFTDLEGSTRLLHQLGDRYADLLADYRRLLRTACQEQGGHEVDSQGDSFFVAFPRAKDALLAAITAQRAVLAHSWPERTSLGIRMGLHTGEPLRAETGYVGIDVHRVARICAAGHGGQILLSNTTRALVEEDLPSDVSLKDLGKHRLKDLSAPEHLFQVVVPGLSANFPALKSLGALPNNLPTQLTSFIGREREIMEVKRLLFTARLLTLTGAGGAGKTRLALQVGAEGLEDFNDGVWLVELAPLSDPSLIPQAIASALRVPEQLGRPLTETLVDYLHHKSLLLLLDNCEHLLSACAHLAGAFLRACPNLRILATSREALGITGEVTYPVPSLSVPERGRVLSVEALAQYEAVQLFAERAAFSRPGFQLTSSNAAKVAQVCHQLDGIPLAIELAAARMKALSVEVIAEKVDDRFRLLTGGSRTALPRHQTLRAAMDWSHDLLSEQERILFRRLSVFVGGFTLDAVVKVCAGNGVDEDEVVDLLTHLIDKSLVVFDGQDGQARYRLLETVRQYGQEKLLASGEVVDLRRRHRDWYLGFAEWVEPKLRSGSGQAMWLERLETEHENLRAALEWSKTEKDGAEAEVRLTGALHWFWFMHGHWSEGRGWLQGALARGSDAPPSALPKAYLGAADFAWRQGDPQRATTLAEEGLVLCGELGDKESMASFHRILGIVSLRQGDYERANARFHESLALSRELGDRWLLSRALSQLGIVARIQGDNARAVACFEESLALDRELGNTYGIAYSLRLLGIAALHQRDYKRAAAFYMESLALCREVGDRWVAEECLEGLAGVAAAERRYEQAATLFGAAEALREALGHRHSTIEQADHEQRVASARAGLTDPTFALAWTQGRAMTLEQAVDYALTPNGGAEKGSLVP